MSKKSDSNYIDVDKSQAIYTSLSSNISSVIKGNIDTIRILLAAFFCGGHVLLDDVPGTGKTTLAKTLAKSIGTGFKRLQFTPDLLPTDILGVSIYNQGEGRFTFLKGPIFTNILLADEINRASPRTQSALLEAMGEKQITIEGKQHPLDDLFFVIATENPVDSHGTYPLPESQMDRFMVELSPGYLDRDQEALVLTDQLHGHPLDFLQRVCTEEDIFLVTKAISSIRISEELRYYIVDLINGTRKAEHIVLGASVRASLALMNISRALALFEGREFLVPEDIQEAILHVLPHRLQLTPQAKFSGITPKAIVEKIVQQTTIPT